MKFEEAIKAEPEPRRRALPARHGAAQRRQAARSGRGVRELHEDRARRASSPTQAKGMLAQLKKSPVGVSGSSYEHIRGPAGRRPRAHRGRGRPRRATRPDDVRLIAVSKTHPIDARRRPPPTPGSATSARTRCRKPCRKLRSRPILAIRWHLIGHLQSNKARKAAEAVDCDSRDRQRRPAAAGRPGRRRARAGRSRCWSRSTSRGKTPSTARRLDEVAGDRRGGRPTARPPSWSG